MYDWSLLERCFVTRNDSPRSVDGLIPDGLLPDDEFDRGRWLDEVARADISGMFAMYVSDLLGPSHGAKTTVYCTAGFQFDERDQFLQFLASTGLLYLVVVDPFAESEGLLGSIGQTTVVCIKDDPLSFLSQIDSWPSVLFHPCYDPDSFRTETAADQYYAALAEEVIRVISNARSMIRSENMIASCQPIAVGFDLPLYFKLLPPDATDASQFPVQVGQAVTTDDSALIGVAVMSKTTDL